jgi:predicted HTH domain antitoxin
MSSPSQIVLDVPAGIDEALRAELTAKANTAVVLGLFEAGKVSSGYGARMLGITRREFLDLLGQHNIPLMSYAEDELEEQIQLAKQLAEDVLRRRELGQ